MTRASIAVEHRLAVTHLSKYFRGGNLIKSRPIRAVDNVSFDLEQSEVLAVVGESGSGKTTLARVVARLDTPTSGRVLLDGHSTGRFMRRSDLLRYRRRIQMIFQDPFSALNPFYSVKQQLYRPLANLRRDLTRHERYEKVIEMMEQVGLSPVQEFLYRKPHELSGGQRQRVVIGRALIVDPDVILADEPTSMLDVSIRMGILNLLEELRAVKHFSYLFITHDLGSARYLSDHIMVMYAGRMLEAGSTDNVINAPAHPYTQLLLSVVPDPTHPELLDAVKVVGSPPDLSNYPTGCAFHPRCPFAMDICTKVVPEHRQVSQGHWAACHLHSDAPVVDNVEL